MGAAVGTSNCRRWLAVGAVEVEGGKATQGASQLGLRGEVGES